SSLFTHQNVSGPSPSVSASHSLRYFSTAVSRPELGDTRYISVGYVDDQQFVRFDSDSEGQRQESRAPWMDNMDQEDPDYWEKSTRISRENTQIYGVNLETLRGYYNESQGVHTVQRMSGCEVSTDCHGRDHRALDSGTLTWTTMDTGAENTKRKWEADKFILERYKAYLEDTYVAYLHTYLEMGKDILLRTGTAAPPPASPSTTPLPPCARHKVQSQPPSALRPLPCNCNLILSLCLLCPCALKGRGRKE
uniref:MHC class I-like antigen recognition-like domain-containing protein n=1 Tax=Monodelphis domestica TaxID=13616 RepID=A0A5F8GCM6_MONDO